MRPVLHKNEHFSRIYNGPHTRSTLQGAGQGSWSPYVSALLKMLSALEADWIGWTDCPTVRLDPHDLLGLLASHALRGWTRLLGP